MALGRFGWPFELFASLLPQIGAVCLLFAASTFYLGRPAVAVSALLLSALCAYGARESFAPADAPLPQRHVRILWANLFGERAAFSRAMRLANAEHADIVVFAEFPGDGDRGLIGAFVHHAGRPEMPGVKIAIFSRLPLTNIERIGQDPKRQGISTTLESGAGLLNLVAVHPYVPALPGMQNSRDRTIANALNRLVDFDGPGVLVGDLNTVTWSRALRHVPTNVTRAQTGSTWMSPAPVLGLPIDHAFAANGARISARVGPGIGSDHLPLIVDVLLPAEVRLSPQAAPAPRGNWQAERTDIVARGRR